jgi:hypothetical protein
VDKELTNSVSCDKLQTNRPPLGNAAHTGMLWKKKKNKANVLGTFFFLSSSFFGFQIGWS